MARSTGQGRGSGEENGAGSRDLVWEGGGGSEGRQREKGQSGQEKTESSPDVWSPRLAIETRDQAGWGAEGGCAG